MGILNQLITNAGLTITINQSEGVNARFFEYEKNDVLNKIFQIGINQDDQHGGFDICFYRIMSDSLGLQIGNSSRGVIFKNGDYYQNLYDKIDIISHGDASNRRALNILLEAEFGEGFYAFNPNDNLNLIQPVQFELSISQAPTEGNSDGQIGINVTDGSGDYEYSIDAGQNWGAISVLDNLPAGTYSVGLRDNVVNSWPRYKSIDLI